MKLDEMKLDEIKSGKKPKSAIALSEKLQRNKLIKVDFNFFSLEPVRILGFTNYMKNLSELVETRKRFFNEFLPYVSKTNFQELQNTRTHTHSITEADKITLIKKILSEYEKKYEMEYPNDDEFGDEFYQVGYIQGFRVIGDRYNDDCFRALFIDPYHLVYPSEKHNDKDYVKYNYQEESSYLNNIKIIKFEEKILELECCQECEVLKSYIE